MMRYRLSSKQRLLTATDYSKVFANSCCKAGDGAFLLLAAQRSPHEDQLENISARLGLVIAKKKLRRAVDRNRVKRVSRESFRLLQQSLEGLDIVLLCRSGAVGLNKREIHDHLQPLFFKVSRSNLIYISLVTDRL